jgi:hypothetical protein
VTGSRDIAESGHALLRAARAAGAAHPGPREDYKRYRPSAERVISQAASHGGRRPRLRYLGAARTTPGSSTAAPPSTRATSPAVAWPATTGHGHWPHPARRHQADPAGTPSALEATDRGHLRLQGMLVPKSGTPLPRWVKSHVRVSVHPHQAAFLTGRPGSRRAAAGRVPPGSPHPSQARHVVMVRSTRASG